MMPELSGTPQNVSTPAVIAAGIVKIQTDPVPSDEIRASNLSSAKRIPDLLSTIQLRLVPGRSTQQEESLVSHRIHDQLEDLAEREHVGWMEHMISHGWCFGEIKDQELRRHPQMRPYDELREPVKEKARQWVREIPDYVRRANFKIVFDDSPSQAEHQ